jgi:hypothetical protein
VFYAHQPDGFRHAPRFVLIMFIGAAGFYGAKGTGAGTHIAQDHKGGGACAPAFAHIGAIAAFANGV